MNLIKILFCALVLTSISQATAKSNEIRPVTYKEVRRSISTLSRAMPSTVVAQFGTPYASVFCKDEKDEASSYYELRYPVKAATSSEINDSFSNKDKTAAECTPIRFYKKNSYKLGLVLTEATNVTPLSCEYPCQKGRSTNKIVNISVTDFQKQIQK